MRVVIDTNVLTSAIFFGGKPLDVIRLIMEDHIEAVATCNIVDEYHETISYLQENKTHNSQRVPYGRIIGKMEILQDIDDIHICRDKDDDKFISCAVHGKCLYIVSGDKDLLTIKEYENVEIVTVAEFLQRYSPKGKKK